ERKDDKPSEQDADVILRHNSASKKKIKITRVPRRLKARTTPGRLPEPKEETADYGVSDEHWEKLIKALDIGASARLSAARLYIRPVEKGEDQDLWPDWCPVQLQLRIGARDKEAAVDATIERFEHPLDVHFRPIS